MTRARWDGETSIRGEALVKTPARAGDEDAPIVPPPASMTVMHEYKAVLYGPDGKALVRRAGF